MIKYTYEELLNLIIKDVPVNHDEKFYGISFLGFPGSGKTTVSKEISNRTGLYIASNDKIRRLLEDLGYDVEGKDSELVRSLSMERLNYILNNKINIIFDANMQNYCQTAIEMWREHGGKLYVIQLKCSEEEILRRLDHRFSTFKKDSDNYSKADKEIYYKEIEKARNSIVLTESIFHIIDTEKEVAPQIDDLIKKISNDLRNI